MQTQEWMAKQIYSQSCQYCVWSDFSWFQPSGLNVQMVNIDAMSLTLMESNWIRWAEDLNFCHSLLSQISWTKNRLFYFHKDVMPSRKSLFLHWRLFECFSGICCLAEVGWYLVKQCMKPVGQVNTVSTRESFHHIVTACLLSNLINSMLPRQLPQRTAHSKSFKHRKSEGRKISCLLLKMMGPAE